MANDVSLFRLYLMRALYLLMFAGLALHIWPQFFQHTKPLSLWHGVGISLLTAMSLLALLGLRYPLKMLPLLFLELAWKAIWLVAVALPLWLNRQVDADTAQTVVECAMGVIVPIVIPWRYAVATFAAARGERWR